MQTMVNPQRFMGQEMALVPLARGQSVVMLAGFRMGRISHASLPDGKSTWYWSLTGPHCATSPSDLRMCGEARTLGQAKLALRHSFDGWLGWALHQEGPIYWHWTEAMPARADLADSGEMA